MPSLNMSRWWFGLGFFRTRDSVGNSSEGKGLFIGRDIVQSGEQEQADGVKHLFAPVDVARHGMFAIIFEHLRSALRDAGEWFSSIR